MPRHLRIALLLCAFGVVGLAIGLIAPRQPAAASGTAIGVAAGGELACRRIVKIGPLGLGARCVVSSAQSGRVAASEH